MDFFADFVATQTITVNPPGGTHNPAPTGHLPLPTATLPHPTPRFLVATDHGHAALWVVFALFTAGLIGVGIMALRVEKKARVFHWLSAGVLTIAMVSYLAMATGLGINFVPIHHQSHGGQIHWFREVYWARYVDWLFTTPLLLVSLAILAGLSPAEALLAIVADIFMIVTGLASTEVGSRWNSGERYKWAWYAISCAGFLVIWIVLLNGGVKAAKYRPSKTRGLFYLLSLMTFILWTAYPIVFALTEGANKISVDAEIIAYGVLDVAAKLGFTFMLLLIHTHGDDDTWTLPEWFVVPRQGSGADGRGGYGAINNDD